MGFDIEIIGLEALEEAFPRAYGRLVEETRRAIVHTAQVTTRAVKQAAPRRTGDLIDSVKPKYSQRANGAGAVIDVGAPYAEFVVEGTRPHIIEAKNARALRFQRGGQTVFAKSVQHPGTKPNDFLEGPANQAEGQLERELERAADAYVAALK